MGGRGTEGGAVVEYKIERLGVAGTLARDVEFGEKARGAQGSTAVSDEDIPF